MSDLSTSTLIIILICLIVGSGFFSGSEIGLMSLNRYRLRNMVRKKHKTAIRVDALLRHPDKLLSAILIGNTFANIFASAIATMIAVRFFGDVGVALSTILLTLVILIFAEIAPKSVAAQYPQNFSFLVAFPLQMIMKLVKPLIFFANGLARLLLRGLGFKLDQEKHDALSSDELRTVVRESGDMISGDHKSMLLSILDLDNAKIEEIMVPRHEIVGIDLADPWDEVMNELETSQHTRLPIYQDSIDNVLGIVHVRRILNSITDKKLTESRLTRLMDPIYCIPEGTPLMTQLLKFREQRERFGFVVDEYGGILGLVTIDDILEEIVGEFTTNLASTMKGIYPEDDGNVIVDGSMLIRDVNRALSIALPEKGPKTISGLIIEELQYIPPPGTTVLIRRYPVEVVQVHENVVKTARIKERLTSVS